MVMSEGRIEWGLEDVAHRRRNVNHRRATDDRTPVRLALERTG
jgi:hypothetical protein